MNALVSIAVLFAVAVSTCLSTDIVDLTLTKTCHEHEGTEAMTKPFLQRGKDNSNKIKYLLIPYRMLRNSTGKL